MSIFNGCAVVLEINGRYVLVRETRGAKAGLYNLPAGSIEAHEDVLSCIVRETREEIGLAQLRIEHFLGLYEVLVGETDHVLLLVFAGSGPMPDHLGTPQHPDVRLVTHEELLELSNSGSLRSPVVMQAIDDYRNRELLPLSTVHTWAVDEMNSITVPSLNVS